MLGPPYPDRQPLTGGKTLGLATPFGDFAMLAALFFRISHSHIIDLYLSKRNQYPPPLNLGVTAALSCHGEGCPDL